MDDFGLELIAASRRFLLGRPGSLAIAEDEVIFLRTRSGTDAVSCLWRLDRDAGTEELLLDPATIVDDPAAGVTAAERSLRERRREVADGIVEFSVDAAHEIVVFPLAGDLVTFAPRTREWTRLDVSGGPVREPRVDPTGRHVAFLHADGLDVVDRAGAPVLRIPNPAPGVSVGAAEFVAAEEMNRHRGYWWAPDGETLIVAEVDEREVATWWSADPGTPERPAVAQRYPAAGGHNAAVSLTLRTLDGAVTPVSWDRVAWPYLVEVTWQSGREPLLTVMDRRQSELVILAVAGDGATREVRRDADDAWVYLIPGTPAWLPDGRLLHGGVLEDTIALFADGEPLTPAGLQVSGVAHAGARVLFHATTEPTEQHVYAWTAVGGIAPLTHEAGVHTCVGDDESLAIVSESLHEPAVIAVAGTTTVPIATVPIATVEAVPLPAPPVRLRTLGRSRSRAVVLLPRPELDVPRPLPVVMDPYGGPLSQRVRASGRLFHEPQWLADQGFAVIVADGHGSPNRGAAWERTMRLDVASAALEDQIDVLGSVLDAHSGELDPARVAMRGWSFGGYLSALAVLRRPDVFAAAIAGAPVTDWRRYDTVASERYLGLPDEHPEAYRSTSLLEEGLTRPLLLIHGLADDNVHPVHSYELARRLTLSGVAPRLALLPGVTHLVRTPEALRTLLRLQVGFLREVLGPASA